MKCMNVSNKDFKVKGNIILRMAAGFSKIFLKRLLKKIWLLTFLKRAEMKFKKIYENANFSPCKKFKQIAMHTRKKKNRKN